MSGMSTAAKDGERPPPVSSLDRLRRPALLTLGIWLALCGGTLYGFSAFEVELMDRCHLSARQLDVIYAMGQLGVGCGLVPGAIFDTFGPRVSLLYALTFTSMGNLGMTFALQEDDCMGLPALAVLFFVLQNGSAGLYQSGLFMNIRSAPPASQGMAAGIVAAGYGLSAALWSTAYQTTFGKDAGRYFAGTGVIFAVTSVVAALCSPWLTRLPDAPTAYGRLKDVPSILEMAAPEEAKVMPTPTAIGRSAQSLPQHTDSVSRGTGQRQSGTRIMASPAVERQSVCATGATGGRSFGRVVQEVREVVAAQKTPAQETGPIVEANPAAKDQPLRQILCCAEFWIYAVTFAFVQAVGSGMFIGNLALMAGSFGIEEETRLSLVRIVSYCNCAGRFVAGVAMDCAEPRGMPRVAHAVWTASMVMMSLLVLHIYPTEDMPRLFPATIVAIGFAYGANWSINPSFLASRFGTAHVGVCFNIIVTGMACTVTLVSYRVGGLYDAAAEKSAARHSTVPPLQQASETVNTADEVNMCFGKQCWETAYALGLGLSFVGLLAAVLGACCARHRLD